MRIYTSIHICIYIYIYVLPATVRGGGTQGCHMMCHYSLGKTVQCLGKTNWPHRQRLCDVLGPGRGQGHPLTAAPLLMSLILTSSVCLLFSLLTLMGLHVLLF